MALFGMTFIVQAVKVPTGSMQNTITIGDHLLVNKFIFAPGESLPFLPQREIRRGDIIVFKYPGNHYDPKRDDRPDNKPIVTNYVKRVIGLPGDRIQHRRPQRHRQRPGRCRNTASRRSITTTTSRRWRLSTIRRASPAKLYDVYYHPGSGDDRSSEDYDVFKMKATDRRLSFRQTSIS